MVVVDGLESLPQIASLSAQSFSSLRSDSLKQLSALASTLSTTGPVAMPADLVVKISQDEVEVGGFAIPRGSLMPGSSCFRFEAPTTALNAMRVLRACQLPKAILLEGSPGVGKTSLVSALAALAGHHLQRINLSDQTDLIDLFGTDLPVEGGQAGEFQWHDAALLDAMQNGDWVLLDEMNLASQTVLEGLNAVLDHRGKVFIPELGRSFDRHPAFRILAAQNPLQQGGGRKGLPRSFLNRFTKVYLQEQTREDLVLICRDLHPVPLNMVENMIAFNEAIRDVTMVTRIVGQEGSPWEFNLRDLFRWFQLLSSPNGLETTSDPVEHLQLVYEQRFRNERDRSAVRQIFGSIFGMDSDGIRPTPFLTPEWFQIGHSLVPRSGCSTVRHNINHEHLDIAESVLKCVEMNWVVSLAGESGAGKRSLIRSVAEGAGRTMGEFAMHPGVDTSDILGSFEQRDIGRLVQSFYEEISRLIEAACDHEPSMAALSKSLRDAYDSVRPGDAESLDNLLRTSKEITEQLPSVHDNSSAMTALELIRKAGPKSAGFAWVDGELLNAIRSGSWFLISEANLCSSSVLDRLNSLCESNGFLVLNEKGSATGAPEIIKPHPDFRLFMTYDPRHGELSRAMRNRGVELFLSHTPNRSTTPSPSLAKQSTLQSMLSLDSSWPDQRISEVLLPVVSHVANTVTLQSMQAMPYFRRFPTTVERKPADLYSHAIAFLSDESMRTAVLQQHGEVIRDQGLPTAFSAAMVGACGLRLTSLTACSP